MADNMANFSPQVVVLKNMKQQQYAVSRMGVKVN